MKLNQHKNERWADTERLMKEEEERQRTAMLSQGFSEKEIEEAVAQGKVLEKPPEDAAPPEETEKSKKEPAAIIDLNEPEFFDDDLTEEDKKYLTIKWGRAYKPYEWVQLE